MSARCSPFSFLSPFFLFAYFSVFPLALFPVFPPFLLPFSYFFLSTHSFSTLRGGILMFPHPFSLCCFSLVPLPFEESWWFFAPVLWVSIPSSPCRVRVSPRDQRLTPKNPRRSVAPISARDRECRSWRKLSKIYPQYETKGRVSRWIQNRETVLFKTPGRICMQPP